MTLFANPREAENVPFVEEEASLFVSLESLASKGLIKTANDIRSVVEEKIGKPVADDYIWDLLHRNGGKKMPRPHQPPYTDTEKLQLR